MSRMIHADESAFSLCQDALLHAEALFEDGAHIDEQLRELRSLFQALCQIDSRYTALGCEFGYIHYKTSEGAAPNAGGGKMVLYLPQQGRRRPRRYIGVNPRKQFETRARIARYEARTALRLRFAEMHSQYAGLIASLRSLLATARRLRDEANDYLPEARQFQQEMEKEHERTLAQLLPQ